MTLPSALEVSASMQALQRTLGEAMASGADLREVLLGDDARRLLPAVRVPRRFDARMSERVLQPAAGVDAASALDELIAAGLVNPVPGRPGWLQQSEQRRAPPRPPAGTEAAEWAAGGARWRALHGALADWFDGLGADGALEALYHRLCSAGPASEQAWAAAYDSARDSFDLARCETLLRLLDECARFVSPALATRGTRERGLLGARAAFADDHSRTSRYLARAPLLQAFEALLQDAQHFILQLCAPGGSGKTMFLRWLGPRWCLPRGVPVARVDFDFLDLSERGLAGAFMLGKLAERLNPQIPGAPLFELLRDVAEERRRALAQPELYGAEALARLEAEVRERLASVLVERCGGQPVLLVFDTMEDATLKHEVDVMALVQAVAALRQRMQALRSGPEAPRLVLVLSGRYPLAEQHRAVHDAFADALVVFPIPPFDAAESRLYLQRRLQGITRQPQTAVLDAVIARALGNPFKLSLYADILLGTPDIGVAELGQGVDVDMLYLIERVLRRLDDAPLHWLLRYGVLARRLTRDFVEQVLLAPMRRSLRGDRRHDDPARDGVAHRDWPRLWLAGKGEPLQPEDVAGLWQRLRGYASASSWISVDAAGADAVVIQPIASHPMRRALLQQDRRVVAQIHRAAIAHARRSAAGGQSGPSGSTLADLTYHDFQLRGAAAGSAWWARIQAREASHGDDDVVLALASVVLSDDLRESELAGAAAQRPPLVNDLTRARALHAAARVHAARAQAEADPTLRGPHDARARACLEQYDALAATLPAPAVDRVADGLLRLRVLGADPRQRERARAALEAALGTRLDAATRGHVLLTLQRAWLADDFKRSRRFAQRWGRWAWREGDARAYGEHLLDEARTCLRAGRPAHALALLVAGREALSSKAGHWSDARAARQAARGLGDEEIAALVAAGVFDAARWRNEQLHAAGSAAPDAATAVRRQRLQAALLLASGDARGAMRAIGALLAALKAERELPAEAGVRARIDALFVQAQAARELMNFEALLDALSAAMALQSAAGDHAGEVATRLHLARVQMLDIGNLQLAAEHLQDSDGALAHEAAELRIEHLLLRALLGALKRDRAHAAALLAQARTLAGALPAGAADWAPLLACTGLRIHIAADAADHALALADAWSRVDCCGARLAPSNLLRDARTQPALPAPLVQRLERLTRVVPLGVAGHRRLRPADRLRLTLQRAELLRVAGLPKRAADELLALAGWLRQRPAGIWMRELALCCDRLGIAAGSVLPGGWFSQLVKAVRHAKPLLGAVYLEAAERAERGADARQALSLVARSIKAWSPDKSPPSVWHLRRLELQARLAGASGPGASAAQRIEELRSQLGWAALATPQRQPDLPAPAAAAAASAHGTVPRPVPTAATSLRIFASDGVLRVDHLENGSAEERYSQKVDPRFAEILWAMGSHRLADAAMPAVLAMLGQRGLHFGRLLASAVLPQTLLERLWAAQRGVLLPQEVMVEHKSGAMHAMPWELMVPNLPPDLPQWHDDDLPISLHPAVGCFWRAPPSFTLQARVGWVQKALGLLIDRRYGPATAAAVAEFQRANGLRPTGGLDAATVAALGARPRARAAAQGPARPRVLLITPGREANIESQRGADASGTSLEWTYLEHGLDVQTLHAPDIDALRSLLAQPFGVVHIAAPIAQSRSSRELSLQFAATHAAGRTTALSPGLLARLLHGSPLVVLETPRPGSRDETVRQLLLRNSFAAQLFEQGELATVVASGLAPPEAQQALSDTLAAALADWVPPAELVRRLRTTALPAARSNDLVEMLGTAGIALFCRDPMVTAVHPAAA